jgi:hypothetical protein
VTGAPRRAGTVALAWLVLVVPLAVAVGHLPPNADIAWLLHVARWMNRGAVLGRDLVEVNPPLAMWLKQPVMALADATGMAPGHAWFGAVALLVLGMGLLAESVLRASRTPAVAASAAALAAWAMFITSVQSGHEFGQREHLTLVLVLPFLLLVGVRLQGAVVAAPVAIACGVLGGLGFAFKPFFVPMPALAALALLATRPARAVARLPEYVAVAAVFLLYGAAVLAFGRPWLASVPAYWPVYKAFVELSPGEVLRHHAWRLGLGAASLVALATWARARRHEAALGVGLAVGMTGFAAALLLQRKPWLYQSQPVAAMALVLLGLLVAATAGVTASRARLARAGLVLALATVATVYAGWEVARTRVMRDLYWGPRSSHREVLDGVRALGPIRSLGALSIAHATGFPVALELDVPWAMRLCGFWTLVSAQRLGLDVDPAVVPISAPRDAAHGADSLTFAVLAEDLETRQPEVLIVARPVPANGGVQPGAIFDLPAYFRTDPRLAALLARYDVVARLPGHELWRLRAPAPSAAPR